MGHPDSLAQCVKTHKAIPIHSQMSIAIALAPKRDWTMAKADRYVLRKPLNSGGQRIDGADLVVELRLIIQVHPLDEEGVLVDLVRPGIDGVQIGQPALSRAIIQL